MTTTPYPFNAQHTFKLNNLVFSQVSSSEAAVFQQEKTIKKMRVTGLPLLYSPLFKEDAAVLFSNESGAFFYAAGKLYQYELRNNIIVATLVFENLPCTGVVNVMKERTTGDFFISTESEGIYRIKKKRFSVINLVDTAGKTPGENTRINNNVVYSLSFWDAQHIFFGGYIIPVSGAGIPRYLAPIGNNPINYHFLHQKDRSHIWINYKDGIQSFDTKTGIDTHLNKIYVPKKAIDLPNGATVILSEAHLTVQQNGYAVEIYRNDSLHFTTMEKVSENCLYFTRDKSVNQLDQGIGILKRVSR